MGIDFIYPLYGKIVKRYINKKPKFAYKLIKIGVSAEKVRCKILPDLKAPKGLRMINYYDMNSISDAWRNKEKAVWTNVFAPFEIMQALDMPCLSMEEYSTACALIDVADAYIDIAEGAGTPGSLCSFQRTFLGMLETGALEPLGYAVTTSTVCDGNLGSFRYLAHKLGTPLTVLDVPQENSEEDIKYLADQLRELISKLEVVADKKLDMERLKEIIHNENLSMAYYREFLELSAEHIYPSSMLYHIHSVYPTHLGVGSEAAVKVFDKMRTEIKKYPNNKKTKRIFWVHTMPFYLKELGKILNFNDKYNIQVIDISLGHMDPLDEEHPIEAIASRLINNIFNRDYDRKVARIEELVKLMKSDAVICFNHWGCKQAFGGTVHIKKRMAELGIPCLVIDGDGVDKRNSPEGQIKTRIEAFFEMLEQEDK